MKFNLQEDPFSGGLDDRKGDSDYQEKCELQEGIIIELNQRVRMLKSALARKENEWSDINEKFRNF